MVAGLAVPGGAGASVAGAGGGGRVQAEGGAGGGGGHGAAVARSVASGEREWWWRGLGVVDGYGRRGERGARRGVWGEGEADVGQQWRAWWRWGEREWWWRGLGVGVLFARWGEGEADMGRRWRSWWCPGERERREQGPRGSWWHLGERERREWVVEARWECGRRGRCAVRGGSGSAAVCGTRPHRSSPASPEASAAPGGPRAVSPGTGGGGEVPCRPWIRHVGVWWRQRLWLSLAGLGPGGPFGVDVVAGGVRMRFLVRGGVAGTGGVAPGGRWGMRVERSLAAIRSAGAVRARGVVARWGRGVGSGSGGGGVGSGGGGAAGGGGVGSGGVGVAGMAHGPLVGFPVPLVGVGGLASRAVPGAAICGGQGGRVGGRA